MYITIQPATVLGVFGIIALYCVVRALLWFKRDRIRGIDERIPLIGRRDVLGCLPLVSAENWGSTFINFSLKHPLLVKYVVMGDPMVVTSDAQIAQELLMNPSFKDKPKPGYQDLKVLLGPQTLVSINGDHHAFQRKQLSKVFASHNMHSFMEAFQSISVRLRDFLTEHPRELSVDLVPIFKRFAMDVIVQAMFSEQVDFLHNADHPLLHALTVVVNEASDRSSNPIHFMNVAARIRFARAHAFLWRFFVRVLNDRRKAMKKHSGDSSDPQHRDLLSLMLSVGTGSDTDGALTDEDIISQCLTFFFAGHETTAITLSWALHFIATNPTVEEGIISESDSVLQHKNTPAYEDVGKLVYTTATVKETLRLAPPVTNFTRNTLQDTELAGNRIPTGTIVSVSPGALHLNEKYWPDPFRFDPTRFVGEADTARHPYAWMPFSMRERNCIGMNFALMEAKTAVATLYRTLVFRQDPQSRPSMRAVVTSGPHQMKMFVRTRAELGL